MRIVPITLSDDKTMLTASYDEEYLTKFDKVYLTTDWRLFVKDSASIKDGTQPVICKHNAEDILKPYYELNENDLLIHIGNLVDDEFYEFFTDEAQEAIFDELFSDIKCHKILVVKDHNTYNNMDLIQKYFPEVHDILIVGKYLISYNPINFPPDGMVNIHGYVPFPEAYALRTLGKHLDIFNHQGAPVEFTDENIKRLLHDNFISPSH